MPSARGLDLQAPHKRARKAVSLGSMAFHTAASAAREEDNVLEMQDSARCLSDRTKSCKSPSRASI
jgi:hypothetical protein